MIDYSKYEKSLKNLHLQFENYQTARNRADLSDLDKEGIAESVIQRFEVCYDCLWKVLKRYLIEGLGIPEVPNSPKPIFRLAHENKLLPAAVDVWIGYADMRVATSHDYDGEKAEHCLRNMASFIADAADIYQAMTGKPWQ